MSGFRKMAKRLRDNAWVSRVLMVVLRPVQRASAWLSAGICRIVRVNGATVMYDGIPLVFPKNVGLGCSSLIFWEGVNGYEPCVWRILRHYLAQSRHFVDVGSNMGVYSVLARKINPEIVVDAFEPVPETWAANRAFQAANGLDPEVVHRLACSDRCGESDIFIPPGEYAIDDNPTATLRSESWQSATPGVRKATIATTTLDDFFERHAPGQPLLIKIDTEDFEAAVLRGAEKTIRRFRPLMMVEVLPREHRNRETWDLLDRFAYKAYAVCREGLFLLGAADSVPSRPITDFLCVPQERAPEGRRYLAYDELDQVKGAGSS